MSDQEGKAPTLLELHDHIAMINAEKAHALITDLHNAVSRLNEVKKDSTAVQAADTEVMRIVKYIDEIHNDADTIANQAIFALGDDAQEMLGQIRRAEKAKLTGVQAELEAAQARAREASRDHETAIAEAQARVTTLLDKLHNFAAANPTVSTMLAGTHRVEWLVDEAETFIADTIHLRTFESLVDELTAYAPTYTWAAEALASLQSYAERWVSCFEK